MSPAPTSDSRASFCESEASRPLPTVTLQGRALIPPGSLSQTIVMGNDTSRASRSTHQQPMSNLSILMSQADGATEDPRTLQRQRSSEADSASGGPMLTSTAKIGDSHHWMGTSAPENRSRLSTGSHKVSRDQHRSSFHSLPMAPPRVKRCMSAKEIAQPLSGSPYSTMIRKKHEIEKTMQQRLAEMRQHPVSSDENSSTASSLKQREGANERRNRIREEHHQAVVHDLCHVVTDLFLAESKLLNASRYGVSSETHRELVARNIREFIARLPRRYAFGADTPSEVLLHMRLMAAARTDSSKAVVHVHNLDDDERWVQTRKAMEHNEKILRLVTIVCSDRTGLLEFITKLLATGGSRVLDADVMLSTDGIVLDRFVVEMNGRLRLDRFVDRIEDFLRDSLGQIPATSSSASSEEAPSTPKENTVVAAGPLYYKAADSPQVHSQRDLASEMKSAIPLSTMLSAPSTSFSDFPPLRKTQSTPPVLPRAPPELPNVQQTMKMSRNESYHSHGGVSIGTVDDSPPRREPCNRPRRELVNRPASSNLDWASTSFLQPVEYVDVPVGQDFEDGVPFIPFEELMLIETMGTGRVSTIYRAAWQQQDTHDDGRVVGVQMVALKVAMINSITGDASNTEELRREADIAAQLRHPHICDLVGITADPDCFCLAYDFCEGGSLLQLLSDTSRYYEYLPIALDIANGMAYLHSRSVIHRDLKPSNILLTKDQRAKIADFGMSVANRGQELTGETGTYRYMAPEVIRHESYSSNADVYSFGICLWQLITREVPFATMTPIQAAYAVAEGQRPPIPPSTPRRLAEIIEQSWDHDSYRRPSFTYIALALADYAKMAFSPANVGAQTLHIANEMLATIDGNATINVDFTTPVAPEGSFLGQLARNESTSSNGENLGLDIE